MQNFSWVAWLIIALSTGACIELIDQSSVSSLSSISDAFSLPLPHRVDFSGEIISPRFSNGALVFDLKNNGLITCYFRHPPSSLFVFSHEKVSVRATLVSTPRGRLCIVERVRDFNAS